MDARAVAPGALRGVVGELRWRDYTAAAINGYSVARSARGEWTLRGTVVLSDAFKMAQRPLLFVAPHAKGAWRWPIRTFDITGGQLTATLGPPEA